MEKPTKPTVYRGVRLPVDLDAQLTAYAEKFNQTRTALVIEAIATLLVTFKRQGR